MLGMGVSLGHNNPAPLWSINDTLALSGVTNPGPWVSICRAWTRCSIRSERL